MELIVNPATVQIPSGFALPLPTQGKRWTGFYRSETKKAGNRYIAKCRYCLIELSGKPEKLHNHVLRCSDWKPTEKAKYIQEVKEEKFVPRKRTYDSINDDEDDSPTEQTSHDDDDNVQQLSAPRQNTILNFFTRPVSQAQSEKLNYKLLKSIIHGNISFNFVDNPYFKDFLCELNPSYTSPSRNMIKGRLLTEMFSDHLQIKLNKFSTLTDITISLDGWTDNSGNSIYGFMALKENQETVIDVLDLSAHRHTGDFLKDKLEEVLSANGIKIPSILACVTDNPSNMSKIR